MSDDALRFSSRAVHHIGVPVRSLDASLAWYREMFGLEPEFAAGGEGPEVSAAVQLENVEIDAAFIRIGGTYLELLEYRHPVGADFTLRNCDVGAMHIAIDVDDIDAACELMRSRGVEFSVAPTDIAEGPLAGFRFCYFRDPDGLQFEFFQSPDDGRD